jgi:hypothetical protein
MIGVRASECLSPSCGTSLPDQTYVTSMFGASRLGMPPGLHEWTRYSNFGQPVAQRTPMLSVTKVMDTVPLLDTLWPVRLYCPIRLTTWPTRPRELLMEHCGKRRTFYIP